MSLSIRSLLPLLLVILQFFAPLLHAHAGQRDTHFGLHVPGLEAYSSASGGSLASQPEASYAAAKDCIVAIDDGIREKRARSIEKPAGGECLPLLTWLSSSSAEPHFLAEFPRPPLLLSRPRPLSLSPRAPPVI
ncbi:hypothetical protein [Methylomicrobium lacus]|uniref:hypothetical protein n=1 Tax=Methylomicrobium lacus TaxID=136992 RepID=UPI0035A848D4